MVEPQVIYKDKDFLVVMKPAGLLMHPFHVGTEKGKEVVTESTLTEWLKIHYPETKVVGDNPEMRPGLVHRLDRDTSGLLIVARTQAAFLYFKEQFKVGGVRKTYLALVSGVPREKEGRIEKAISLKPGTTKRTVHGGKMTKEAVTEYETIQTFSCQNNSYALLKVRPLTGRTHQIRVHLTSIGHPIVGDVLYGHRKKKRDAEPADRLMLHALSLSFATPRGKILNIEEKMPDDFKAVLDRMEKE